MSCIQMHSLIMLLQEILVEVELPSNAKGNSFSLPDGGHIRFLGENDVETSNRCQIWNPRGRFTLKSHIVHDTRCSGSKLDFQDGAGGHF